MESKIKRFWCFYIKNLLSFHSLVLPWNWNLKFGKNTRRKRRKQIPWWKPKKVSLIKLRSDWINFMGEKSENIQGRLSGEKFSGGVFAFLFILTGVFRFSKSDLSALNGFVHWNASAEIVQELVDCTECWNRNLQREVGELLVRDDGSYMASDALTLKMSLKKFGFGWNSLTAVYVTSPESNLVLLFDVAIGFVVSTPSLSSFPIGATRTWFGYIILGLVWWLNWIDFACFQFECFISSES